MITTSDLTKVYDKTVVVDHVSVSLPDAGVTSVIGANGAGKSTLLSMISRILDADAGLVAVDGLDVFNAPSREIAKRLSILRQETHMTARITVREVVEFGRYPHSRGRLTAECVHKVDEAIAYCDLGEFEQRGIHELSGGQRQRAFIAMVLAQDTRYVLLDEPLNNLDMPHATSVMKLLRRLADDHGKSIVLVLHDINYASVYSDRIVAMKDGVIAADGPPESVMNADTLESIYGMRFSVIDLDGDRIAAYFR
ncbi:iron ABC transporter ATP-binding protein [Demequina aurantiaca]|uniref:iron ABC transporter ATP-binding protein n=1 Tax=Demequina aurantiaca TaxID=676200 RepID=UPI00078131FB|nr:ATP-binding cassette domain-containing protein [Demequina aurantiaca]